MEMCYGVSALADDFAACTKILTALGDKTRQHLILEMMRCGNCSGVRVCKIAEKRTCPAQRRPTICKF